MTAPISFGNPSSHMSAFLLAHSESECYLETRRWPSDLDVSSFVLLKIKGTTNINIKFRLEEPILLQHKVSPSV